MTRKYKPLEGGDFFESFIVEVRVLDWPNDFLFVVWSPRDKCTFSDNHRGRIRISPCQNWN